MTATRLAGTGGQRKILAFGEVMVRLSPPDYRLLVQAQTLDLHVGGAEANVLGGLASLGHSTRMLTALPLSNLGATALAALASAGLGVDGIVRSKGRMGLYFLEQGQGARASSIIYDRAASAFADHPLDAWDFDAALDGVGHVHLSGITPALGIETARAAQRLADVAVARGVTISFDGNFRPQLWASWDGDPRSILTPLVACANVMIGNHRDIALLLDKPFGGDGEERRREAAQAAFAAFPRLELIASTARHVLGADHHQLTARVDRRDASYQSGEVDVTSIVDRIGTGDAYAAGVLDGWLRGVPLEEMAENGLAMALLKHSLRGDMPLFSGADVAAAREESRDVRR